MTRRNKWLKKQARKKQKLKAERRAYSLKFAKAFYQESLKKIVDARFINYVRGLQPMDQHFLNLTLNNQGAFEKIKLV